MAEITTENPVESIKGKLGGTSSGYFYMRNGKQFYRTREENYQQNQSPRQKWNSAAFAYAHKQLRAIESDVAQTAQMNADYDAANHLAPPTANPIPPPTPGSSIASSMNTNKQIRLKTDK
jgi:hypothetical protein